MQVRHGHLGEPTTIGRCSPRMDERLLSDSTPIGTHLVTIPTAVPVIGLIGGIGAGKTSVARQLQRLRPVLIIDADRLGHEALEDPRIKQRLIQHFGPQIQDPQSGAILRHQLAKRVFGTSPRQQADKRFLESVVHPEIRRRIEEQIRENRHREDLDAIVLDAAVLLESGWSDACDAVAFLDVPDELRWQRVAASRGWTREDWKQRECSQLPLAEKRRRATWCIDNAGRPEIAAQRLATLIDRLKAHGVTGNDKTPHG